MKKILMVLILSGFALTGCKDEQKTITKIEQPHIEKTQEEFEKQAVTSDQKFAKNEAENTEHQSTNKNKTQNYDQKVEEAKIATLDAANKLADVMGTKMEQVTEQLADKINEIDVNKVTEPLKKHMDKLGEFLDQLETDKQPEQKPKTKIEEGYL
ncbi:hypothetical protein [Phocoenobacter skyensis]|uniref:Lipoprotein n=1 Tax=Phocoenobacter skyensis TaxID=97481 RepID=A0A1H7XRK7_9PAST|nr:hypothetical protein [Pasteurella skyensis]MDP8170456.1 hypothetical protein [Pasteurella skyensis]MDP8175741.1 hypothetical protein [Pasteurella skyensis]MDP8184466.1 hypothetical protein [Pasteurella skyensis]QLB23268.1 hypothetical protein A6B44_08650 [Pasteurella skyensis]SEM36391.1 hypothetical protein SAMN05444853_11412 [Pasteurella skyensis]